MSLVTETGKPGLDAFAVVNGAGDRESNANRVSATRLAVQRIDGYLAARPHLKPRYDRAKEMRRIAHHANNYDLTSRCNLFCEGCFYFEGEDYKSAVEENDIRKWRGFFKAQAKRGVTFASIAGAEPALEQERLRAARDAIPRGVVFTNGTIKIDRAIRYPLVISIWGDEETTAEFRGGGVFWKSIKTCAGDDRARILFTVHARNVHQIPAVTQIVADHGLLLSYNYFSPTESYLQKLAAHAPNDDQFFRTSSEDDNLTLTPEALVRVRDAIDEAIDLHPNTVFHTHAFNKAATRVEGFYDIDPESGIARDCNARNFRWHQTHRVDLQPSQAKCCTPNVVCSTCRLVAVALGTILFRHEDYSHSSEAFEDWLDICEQWGRSYLLDTDPVWSIGTETPVWHAAQPAAEQLSA